MERGVKIETLFFNQTPNAFECEKGGVAFVHVKNFRFDSEGIQSVDAADPKDDFLAHSHFEIAPIKLSRDQAVFRFVLRNIGVEQVKIDASDVKFPKARVYSALENSDLDQERAIFASNFANR